MGYNLDKLRLQEDKGSVVAYFKIHPRHSCVEIEGSIENYSWETHVT
jgi:hypothetical protein